MSQWERSTTKMTIFAFEIPALYESAERPYRCRRQYPIPSTHTHTHIQFPVPIIAMLARSLSLPLRRTNAEDAKMCAHDSSSYSSRSCMKLLIANKACLRLSWSTSRPPPVMLSAPTLTSPSALERPGRQAFAMRQRVFVTLSAGHDGDISLLSRRIVRALRTLRNMLRNISNLASLVCLSWHTLVSAGHRDPSHRRRC
jgi:hypothetical protein